MKRMNRDRNWTRPERKNNRHPAGLKGKDIGLYYKNKNKGPKKEKEFVVNLTIPKQVTNQLSKNIQLIVNKANKQGIPVPSGKTTHSVKIEHESPKPTKKVQSDSESDMDTSESKFKTPLHFSGHTSLIKNEIVKEEITSNSTKHLESKKLENVTSMPDFIPIKQEPESDCDNPEPILSLRGAGDFKYGYQDIITGSFQEKLDENLSSGITIVKPNSEYNDLSCALKEEYKDMVTRPKFNKMMDFRKTLPTYKKSKELLEIIEKNQVIVISGETGCGKSTQVPQLILDEAINKDKGANVKILVTQPRRIAASSLANRVADERAERVGNSVGYAVRLEKIDSRPRGSIMFVTTGILLADLEVNQGLVNYSHVILDEVHERDCHVDLAMCMLKQVLKKRKDLKLILMSATLDAKHLSMYFDNCPTMHIEGLAYPVKDIYLEEILQMTKFQLPPPQIKGMRNQPKWMKYRNNKTGFGDPDAMEKDIQYKAEISPWLESIKRKIDYDVYKTLQDSRIEELNIDLMLKVLIHICKGPPGAILVFLPGIGDITKLLRKMDESNMFLKSKYEIYPLHSKLPSLEQHRIFERPPGNTRKIIIATNIAETSITIDDIVYVVDCGRIKINGLNIEQNISTLKTEWVSIANLRQRRGRAGRCQAGVCYHLLTTHRAKTLPERLLPELQRSNLLEPVLTIKRLRLGMADVALNMVPDPPSNMTILSAVKHLQQCGALDVKETLTPLGWHLARLPVHPAAGKLLLLGALFGCLDRAASVAAVWGFKDPFQLVIGKEKEVDECKRELALGEPSDHIAVSEAIIEWEKLSYNQRRAYVYDNFLSMNTLQLLSEMKKQLGSNLKQMGFLPSGNVKAEWENRNKGNFSLFKTLVAAALYPNIATVRWLNHKWHNPRKPIRIIARTPEDGRILIHPSSVMSTSRGPSSQLQCNAGANWLVYWLKQRSSDLFLFDVTLVYTLPLLFFGELRISQAEDSKSDECFILISTVKVRCKKETVDLLMELRALLDQVLASKIMSSSDHSTVRSPFEEEVLNAVINLITAEDEQADMMGDDDQSESDQSEYESSRKRWHH